MARLVSGPSVTSVISPGRARGLVEDDVDGVAVGQRPRRRRQLGVAEALRPVRLGRRLERPDERDLAPERDLDVGPPGELEDRPRVDRRPARASMLPDTQVAATSSASGDAAAYRRARLSSMPVSTSRMSGACGRSSRRC